MKALEELEKRLTALEQGVASFEQFARLYHARAAGQVKKRFTPCHPVRKGGVCGG